MGRSVAPLTDILIFFVLSLLSTAQEYPQSEWVQPTSPNNSTVLTIGQVFTIEWKSDFWKAWADYIPEGSPLDSDLWIMGYYSHQYATLVSSNVNVNASTTLLWVVSLPAEDLVATPWWVFRFLQGGETNLTNAAQISSPGVFVENASTITTTSSTTITSQSSASTAAASTTSTTTGFGSTASSTDAPATPSPEPSVSGGLSAGAKAGIAIGVVIGAAALGGMGWILALRRKKSSSSVAQHAPLPPAGPYVNDYKDYPMTSTQFSQSQPIHYSEIESTPPARMPAELSGS